MRKALLIASLMVASQHVIVDVPAVVTLHSSPLNYPQLTAGNRIRRGKGEKKRNKANRWK